MYIHNDTECLWDTEYFRGGYRRVTGFYIHRDKRRFIIIGNLIKDVTNSIELKKKSTLVETEKRWGPAGGNTPTDRQSV